MEKREENPGELLRRARESARRAAPAPQPKQADEGQSFVPRHGAYSALMRSHDRVSTRHIGVKT